MTIKFSIITITRNNRAGFAATADSIQNQTFHDYEWIVVDGNSTDGTKEDFARYPSAKITSEPDNGIYDAMNKGMSRSGGDYLIFMNAGDRFAAPDTLEKTSVAVGAGKHDLVYGNAYEENQLKPAKSHTDIEHGLFTHHQAIFYNRQSLEDLVYDTRYKIAADYDLTLRFLKARKRDFLYLPFPICIFEGGGISQQNIKQGRHEQFLARQNAGIPLFRNLCITGKQKAASFIRRLFPALYWKIKALTRYQCS